MREMIASDIVLVGSEMFNIHPDVIYEDNRTAFICRARFGLYMALHLRGANKSQIGRIMRRDHSTIIHRITRAEGMMKEDAAFRRIVNELVATRVDLGYGEKEPAND